MKALKIPSPVMLALWLITLVVSVACLIWGDVRPLRVCPFLLDLFCLWGCWRCSRR